MTGGMRLRYTEQSKSTKHSETLITCIFVQRGRGLATATKQIINYEHPPVEIAMTKTVY